jgi:predicted DNA-binding transcriptional regulator AlpA
MEDNDMDIWPEMLSVKELTKFLGVSTTKLYLLRLQEDFPPPRRPNGKRPMYVTQEVREWMKNLKK